MPTSPTGSDPSAVGGDSTAKPSRGKREAFTLIELLIVLVVLSILFFIVTPRFMSSLSAGAGRSFVRRLQNTLTYAGEKSILQKKVYLFTVDLDARRYFFTVSEEGNPEGAVRDRYLAPVTFPKGVVIEGIRLFPGDVERTGKAVIPFTPQGMLLSFEVAVREGEGTLYVVRGSSLTNDVEIVRVQSGGEKPLY